MILLWKLVDKMKGASLLVTGGYDMDRMPYFKSAMQDYFIQLQPNVWGLKDYKEPQTKWYKQVFRVFNK